MLKVNKVAVVLGLLLFINVSLIAQNSTNSPYTRYGFGSIADRSFSAGRSMGGIGYGLRSPRQINPMNPASYTSMDSLTFLFDAGASIYSSWYDDGLHKQEDINGNFEYAAMQFPISRRMAMSIGIMPYSHVGYDFYSITTNAADLTYTEKFKGTGGLNEVYVGWSVDIWKKRLAFGANVSYLFGSINHESSSESISIYTKKKVDVSNLKYDLGLQYTHPLSKTDRLTLGLTYSPKIKLKTTEYNLVSKTPDFSSTIPGESDTLKNDGFDIPNVYGLGLSYTKDNKMTLEGDVSFQEWSDAQYYGSSDGYKNMLKVAVGGEYIPDNFTRTYLKRVRYRAGFHYNNSYLKIKGSSYDEYGATLGAGFPMMDNRSFINVSLDYVNIVPESSLLIKEQYLRLTISYTFNEYWFFKRKVE